MLLLSHFVNKISNEINYVDDVYKVQKLFQLDFLHRSVVTFLPHVRGTAGLGPSGIQLIL